MTYLYFLIKKGGILVAFIGIVSMALFFGFSSAFSSEENTSFADHVPNEVLVMYKDESSLMGQIIQINSTSVGKKKSETLGILGSKMTEDIRNKIGSDVTVIPHVLFQKEEGNKILGNSEGGFIFGQVKSGEKTTKEMIELLKDNSDIALVEPNYLFDHSTGSIEESWNIQGDENGVRAKKAWDKGYTGEGVVVAVIDTGVDLDHQDLAGNIWRNTGETECGNNVDDDGNGYIDDCFGWDFSDNDNDPNPGHFHGTHVAGSVAAVLDDSGVVGVAPGAKIMPIKVFSDDAEQATTADILSGMDYAVQNGAHILSMSLGSITLCPDGSAFYIFAERAKSSGVMVIAASGNSGPNIPSTPAVCSNVYSVGATNSSGGLASFSSYWEETLDFVAPGVKVASTMPDGKYAYLSGTSMAAPHVSGVAALIKSKNMTLSPQQIGEMMCEGTDDLGVVGKDSAFGCGLLNVGKIFGEDNQNGDDDPNDDDNQNGDDDPNDDDNQNGDDDPNDDDPNSVCSLVKKYTQDVRFASPKNFFSSSEATALFLRVFSCEDDVLNIEVGNGLDNQYIWKKAYIFESGRWEEYNLNFQKEVYEGKWGVGLGKLQKSKTGRESYVISYTCTFVGEDQWKCGCDDEICEGRSAGKWKIQAL
jgi:subtilisin family serine protease